MKQLTPHSHVIKLLGCVTESGKFCTITLTETVLLRKLYKDSTVWLSDWLAYSHAKEKNSTIVYQWKSWQFLRTNAIPSLFNITRVSSSHWKYLVFFSEPLLVLIEFVPFGDLLGYLRKSRGLNDTYYKDPDIKPKTSLTSQQLMKFAWQIADGMSYLSSKRVNNVLSYWFFTICALFVLRHICTLLLETWNSNGFHGAMSWTCTVTRL